MSRVSERRFEDEIEHSLLTRGSLVKCGREAIERLEEYRTAALISAAVTGKIDVRGL